MRVDTIDYSAKAGFICDMDGVIYHGNRLLDGASRFVDWLKDNDKKFLFLHELLRTQSSRVASEALAARDRRG